MDRPFPTLPPPSRRRQALEQARPHPRRCSSGRKGTSAPTICSISCAARTPGIGRATVYRTLQWMVDAGIARKVDFGEGRSRFEPSYRHPRHFHLICTTCHRSSEFLSSDIESLIEEIAAARNFTPTQTVVQIYGTCEECRTGTRDAADRRRDDRAGVRARRAAHGDRHRAQRPRVLHARRGADQRSRAAARCSRSSPRRRESISARSRSATASCSPSDPQLESRPTFLFFKGAASGLFAEGAEELRKGVDDRAGAAHRHQVRARLAQVLQTVRRALRGLRRQADLPRVRRRGARAPRAADPRVPRAARAAARQRPRRARRARRAGPAR